MKNGKHICELLKAIRQQIADENHIVFDTKKCTSKADCKGSCPACDKELLTLEDQLQKRKSSGSPIKLAVLSASLLISNSFASDSIQTNNTSQDSTSKTESHTEPDDIDMIFGAVQMTQASFPGGIKSLMIWLQENLQYPEEALNKNIQGKVFVSFIVGKDGTIRDAKITRSVDPSLDAEALRVVNLMPKWNPAIEFGIKTDSRYNLPINFKIEKKEETSNEQ